MRKGLIFDIRRYSVHDGPGIRTTVFLKGCSLRCAWCHNPESWLNEPQPIKKMRSLNGHRHEITETVGKWYSADEVMEVILKDRLFYEESGGGVTFSGGEPMLQEEFLKEMLQLCKQNEIQTAVDTSGSVETEVFKAVSGKADLLLYDIKTSDEAVHIENTGSDNKLILKNLEWVKENGPDVIIRIPVIPGVNNNNEEMQRIRDILVTLRKRVKRVDLLPYHRLGRQKFENLGMTRRAGIKGEITSVEIKGFMEVFSQGGFPVKKGG